MWAGFQEASQVLESTEDGKMIGTGPGLAVEDAVGGAVQVGEGGEVDGDDGEGGGVTTGVDEGTLGEGRGEVFFGFVHAGNVD